MICFSVFLVFLLLLSSQCESKCKKAVQKKCQKSTFRKFDFCFLLILMDNVCAIENSTSEHPKDNEHRISSLISNMYSANNKITCQY